MAATRREALRLLGLGSLGLLPSVFACTRWARSAPVADFLAAVRTGDAVTVERLLDGDPALLRGTDPRGRTAFALAHLAGHTSVGELLVRRGYRPDAHEAALAQDWERFATLTDADVSSINEDHPIGGTAMYAAALGGAGADIWRIFAATGSPNAVPRGSKGASPLEAALPYPDLATAEMTAATLLSNNASPNPHPRGELADTPLHVAARRGSTDLVEMLIRLGAVVDAKNQSNRTPREVAERAGHERVVALLVAHDEIPRTHSSSRAAYTAEGRHYTPPDISDIPLAKRSAFVGQCHRNFRHVRDAVAADPRLVHAVATTSEICVEACAHTGQVDIVSFLLDHGAVYSLPTAVMRGDRSRAEQLLDEDPLRIHERGAHDFPLLWYPVIGGTGAEMLELLLERGANVERQHFLGTTALHWACLRGPIEVVELLLEHGADVQRRGRKFNSAGETPLEVATRRGQTEIAALIRARAA